MLVNDIKKVSWLSLFCLFFSGLQVNVKAEGVYTSDIPYYTFKGRTPHIVLPLSVEFPIIGNAWRYDNFSTINGWGWIPTGQAKNYENSFNIGLFNPLICYQYNTTQQYFYPYVAATYSGGDITCPSQTFSGNLMNWATHSTLDIIRYALTGGSRMVDDATNTLANNTASTIVRRANILPTHHGYFSQRTPSQVYHHITLDLQNLRDFEGSQNWAPARFANNHRDEITFTNNGHDVLIVQPSGDHLQAHGQPGATTYKVNVLVCNYDENKPEISDALLRPEYCKRYGNLYKPVGVLQNMDLSRVSLLSYLQVGRKMIKGVDPEQQYVYKGGDPNREIIPLSNDINADVEARLWGGVLRSPGVFLNNVRYDVNLNFANNPNQQIDQGTGVITKQNVSMAQKINPSPTKTVGAGGASIINYINEFGYLDGYRSLDNYSELLAEAVRYIGNYNSPTTGILDPNQPNNVSRDPFYFYRKLGSGSSLLKYHTDDHGFFTNWNWKQMGWDEPVRSVCEKDSIRLITMADSNHWRSSIRTNGSGLTYTSAFGNDVSNTIFKGKRLNDIFTEAGLNLNEVSWDLYNPWVEITHNKNVVPAILGAANRYGINYQKNAYNQITDVKLKSTMIDVGEPHHADWDCNLYDAGFLGSGQYPNQMVNKQACVAFMNLAGAYSGSVRQADSMSEIIEKMPSGYFFPSQPQQLVHMIKDAFKLPIKIDGSFSAGTLGQYKPHALVPYVENFTFSLNSFTNSKNFQTIESLPEKYHLQQDAGGKLQYVPQDAWAAAVQTSLKSAGQRNIYLGNQIFKAADIENLNQSSSAYLKTIPKVLLNAGLGFSHKGFNQTTLRSTLVNYLRGDTTYADDTMFRKRNSMLGSTQNSSPKYVAKIKATGRNIVYIGGNDGMLHALDSQTGQEHFAYIPYALLGKISETAKPSYQNKALLETQPIIERLVHDRTNRIVLAGGFGAGQKGVYALDVTNMHTGQTAFNANNVLFEFTEQDDPNIGHVIGQPEFIKRYNQQTKKNQYFLALTSGYNSTGDMYLYLLDVSHFLSGSSKHAGIAKNTSNQSLWIQGVNYHKLKISDAEPDLTGINQNGFTTVASLNMGGQTKAIYFADLKGMMYKVNLNAFDNTTSATTASIVGQLNIVKRFNTSGRPITVKPNMALSKEGGIWVVFGTGRFLGLNDLGRKHSIQQSLIGFKDDLTATTQLTLTNLNQYALNVQGNQILQNSVLNSQGWYVDFANSLSNGERMTSYPEIENGSVVFTTQSTGNFDVNSCGSNTGGVGVVNLETGQMVGTFKTSQYILGSLLLLPPLTNDELIVTQSLDSSQTSVLRNGQSTSMHFITGITSDEPVAVGRAISATTGVIKQGTLSWREISR